MEDNLTSATPPNQPQVNNTETKFSHKFSKIFTIVLLELFLIAGSVYAGMQIQKIQSPQKTLTISQPTPTQATLPVSPGITSTIPTQTNLSMMKKHFNPTEGFMGKDNPFPQELLELKDENLLGFECSKRYMRQLDGSYVYNSYDNETKRQISEKYEESDILTYVDSQQSSESSKNFDLGFMTCQIDDGRTLIVYDTAPNIIGGGGGVGADTSIGFFQGDSTAVAKIPMENGPYFHCSDVLAITNFDMVYALCGAGDGGFGSKSIYKVGLYKAYSADLLYRCISTADVEGQTPNTNCSTSQ